MCVLLSHFLPEMISKDVDHPTVINVDNHDFEAESNPNEAQPGQLFYDSVIAFQDTFVEKLPKHVRDKVKTISLKTNFDHIPETPNDEGVQSKVC